MALIHPVKNLLCAVLRALLVLARNLGRVITRAHLHLTEGQEHFGQLGLGEGLKIDHYSRTFSGFMSEVQGVPSSAKPNVNSRPPGPSWPEFERRDCTR